MTITDFLSINGLKAKDLADGIGLSTAQVSRILSGKSSPSWRTAKAISEFTGGVLTPAEIMEPDETAGPTVEEGAPSCPAQ